MCSLYFVSIIFHDFVQYNFCTSLQWHFVTLLNQSLVKWSVATLQIVGFLFLLKNLRQWCFTSHCLFSHSSVHCTLNTSRQTKRIYLYRQLFAIMLTIRNKMSSKKLLFGLETNFFMNFISHIFDIMLKVSEWLKYSNKKISKNV